MDKLMHMVANAGIFVVIFTVLMGLGMPVWLSGVLGLISALLFSVVKEMKDLTIDMQELDDSKRDMVADVIGMVIGAILVVIEYYLVQFLSLH